MTTDRRWTDADRELVAQAIRDAYEDVRATEQTAAEILNALAAAGWEPRCDCDGVAHDLPILRSHVRGEPGCTAHACRGATDG